MTVPAGAAGTAPPGGRLPVVVAPLRSRDLKAVLRIEGDVFDEPWSRQLFESELAQRASRAYRAAWVGTDLVGYAGQMAVDDEAHVNNIAVAPAWVGRRLGTVLLYDLVRTALARRRGPPHARGGRGQRAGDRPLPAVRSGPGGRAAELLPRR